MDGQYIIIDETKNISLNKVHEVRGIDKIKYTNEQSTLSMQTKIEKKYHEIR